ncbi:MAG TPA: 16S rRNA (guanine(527)-N(7))-methyltransferase RsmG [Candidatus Cybelea sp.]|nr:16S rRNA (guanine(527)-N(7))-methyltransferase RsmG [Candidatus Cybelea sp.]
MTALEELLADQGVDAPAVAALSRYGRLVLEANRRFNVTGARSSDEIARHISDSLSVVPYLREPYVDVGSGAGFPAIPIGIVTGVPLTLIEATLKKARLLESFLETLGLRGVVVAERAEVAGHRPDLREHFASGTCRAVATAPAVAELLLPLIGVGGAAVLQRGRTDAGERRSLEDAALVLGASLESDDEIGDDRHIILLRKLRETPARFPRRTGAPQKRPLCQ